MFFGSWDLVEVVDFFYAHVAFVEGCDDGSVFFGGLVCFVV